MRTLTTTLTSLALLISASAQALTVHEWGTFTSLVTSDGQLQQGLHHEEDPLPNFVYDLSRVESPSNDPIIRDPDIFPPTRSVAPPAMERMPIPTFTERVTQKMETPVLYFHSDKAQKVNVRVDFPKGIISQWFPATSSQNDNSSLTNGFANWDIKVLANSQANLPFAPPENIWNPARQVKANTVEVNGEQERFIFYRGLANFNVALSFKISDEQIIVSNNSAQAIPNAYILNFENGKGRVLSVGAIAANAAKTISLAELAKQTGRTMFDFMDHAANTLATGLEATGLYADEARSMVNTWKHSYFGTSGLRLLYVLPREWTDALLPISITPKPESVVRTLVGRVEILTPSAEANLLKYALSNLKNSSEISSFRVSGRSMPGIGHFPEPKLRRVMSLTNDIDLINSLNNLITRMNRGLLFR